MLKGVIVVNNFGKPRMIKFYEHYVRIASACPCETKGKKIVDDFFSFFFSSPQPVDEQQRIIREIFALVSKRTERACNFLENKGIVPGADAQGAWASGFAAFQLIAVAQVVN